MDERPQPRTRFGSEQVDASLRQFQQRFDCAGPGSGEGAVKPCTATHAAMFFTAATVSGIPDISAIPDLSVRANSNHFGKIYEFQHHIVGRGIRFLLCGLFVISEKCSKVRSFDFVGHHLPSVGFDSDKQYDISFRSKYNLVL